MSIENVLNIISAFNFTIDLNDKFQVYNMIKFFDDAYRAGGTLISDAAWTTLVEYYDATFTEDYEEKVAASGGTPFPMGSPKKKAYTQHDLDLYAAKYPGPWLLSDKIDGVTAMADLLTEYIRIFSKGGGKDGEVLNGIKDLPHIDFTKIPRGMAVRGELVLPKENFKFTSDRKTMRDVPSAFVRTQTKEERHLAEGKLLDFYAYKLYSQNPNDTNMNILTMYQGLQNLGFKVPEFVILDRLIQTELIDYFNQRQANAPYEMDGLFITPLSVSMNIPEPKKIDSVIAFKVRQEGALAKVTGMQWNPSSNQKLKPVVEFEPINLVTGIDANGNEMVMRLKQANAYNARNVINEGIGMGALVWIARKGDAAPGVVKVEMRSDDIIYPREEYVWNDTKVDFMQVKATPTSIGKAIDDFAKSVGVRGVGPKVAETLVLKYNIESIHDFIINFVMTNCEEKIVKDIRNAASKTDNFYLTFMIGSKLFAPKFGEKKLSEFFNVYQSTGLQTDLLFQMSPERLHEIISSTSFRKQEEDFTKRLSEFFRLYSQPITHFWYNGVTQFTRTPIEGIRASGGPVRSSGVPVRSSVQPRTSQTRSSSIPLRSSNVPGIDMIYNQQAVNGRISQLPGLRATPMPEPGGLLRTSAGASVRESARTSAKASVGTSDRSSLRHARGSSNAVIGFQPLILNTSNNGNTDHRQYLLNLISDKRVLIFTDETIPYEIISRLNIVNDNPEVVIYSEGQNLGESENILFVDVKTLI